MTNIAQALGEKVYVTVDGQGAPASTSTGLPYRVSVAYHIRLRVCAVLLDVFGAEQAECCIVVKMLGPLMKVVLRVCMRACGAISPV